jgi:hypothetical protein
MSRARTSRPFASLLGVLLVAALAGCGGGGSSESDGDHPSSGPSSTAPTTGSTSPSTSSATSSGTSSGTSSAGVPAAAGESLTAPGVVLHLPAGWKVQQQGQLNAAGFDPGGSTALVYLVGTSAFPTDTLDSVARISAHSAKASGHGADRQPDRVVDGVRGYVLSGSGKIYR